MAKAKERIADGKLVIDEEGSTRKFVDSVQQVTFSGRNARPDQTVLYVTERCVLQLIDGKMTVVEIAPGIDLERDALSQMDFRPAVHPDLKTMDPGLFCEEWGGLRSAFEANR